MDEDEKPVDISTDLAWHRERQREERDRPCPHCGGKTLFMHVKFDRKNTPHRVPSSWVHLCGKCNFMAYLTGDLEVDRTTPNMLGD